ncbi:hypothetical protein ACYSNW_01020 [Enterococcus sp. LJL99]
MKKSIKRQLLINLSYLGIPLLSGCLLSLWLKWSISSCTAVFYGILLVFMIPSDVFLGSSLDYKTKSINPSFKPNKLNINGISKEQLITFILIVLAFVSCLLLSLMK